MIDSHAHIEMCDGDAAEVVKNAALNGVNRILTVAINEDHFSDALRISEAHEQVFAAIGWHPNDATGYDDRRAAAIRETAKHPRVRAIGETGLDFYRDSAPPEDQRRAFISQIEIANELQLPLTIHARAAEAESLDMLDQHVSGVDVVLHCFSAPELLDRAIERGYLCSFAGNVTYKNAPDLRAAAARVPDELLLVETDAPFLSPQPVRGKRNEPANVTMTAETIAEVRGLNYGELSDLVEANAKRVFNW